MNAIINYICRKHNALLPQTDEQKWRTDQMVGVTSDFRMGFVMMSYRTGDKAGYLKDTLPDWLVKFEKYFSAHEYCAGDLLTHVDFNLFEILDHVVTCFPGAYDNSPKLKAFWERIGNIGVRVVWIFFVFGKN